MTNELTHKFYHERQRRQLCLLHALNNLMQCEEFTQAELDCVCERSFILFRFNIYKIIKNYFLAWMIDGGGTRTVPALASAITMQIFLSPP